MKYMTESEEAGAEALDEEIERLEDLPTWRVLDLAEMDYPSLIAAVEELLDDDTHDPLMAGKFYGILEAARKGAGIDPNRWPKQIPYFARHCQAIHDGLEGLAKVRLNLSPF